MEKKHKRKNELHAILLWWKNCRGRRVRLRLCSFVVYYSFPNAVCALNTKSRLSTRKLENMNFTPLFVFAGSFPSATTRGGVRYFARKKEKKPPVQNRLFVTATMFRVNIF